MCKKPQTEQRLRTPPSRGVEKSEGPSALQPTTEPGFFFFFFFFLFMHFYPGTITTQVESINSDLQLGLDRHLRHTQH